jgi:hypothetical protein
MLTNKVAVVVFLLFVAKNATFSAELKRDFTVSTNILYLEHLMTEQNDFKSYIEDIRHQMRNFSKSGKSKIP